MHGLDYLSACHGVFIAIALLLAGIGLPLPKALLLLTAGALAGAHKINLAAALLVAPGCLSLGDWLWFFLGQKFGKGILRTVCRFSLEKDVCIRKTQEAVSRHGLRVLLFSRFVPGLSALAPPMAGASGNSLSAFAAYDLAGTAIYTSLYITLGFLFAGQLDQVILIMGLAGQRLTLALVLVLVLYIAFKFASRYRLLRKATTLAIEAAELHEQLATSPQLLLVDLRGPADLSADPFIIAGSRLWRESDLMKSLATLPPKTRIVLCCACPNQATSTRVAMTLQRKGFQHVRVLRDGIIGWRNQNLPLQTWSPTATEPATL